MNSQSDTPAHLGRYDNVDVLSLLDPNWLENTQAATLVRMMCQAQADAEIEAGMDHSRVERGVAVLAA